MPPRHVYVHVPFCARRCSYCDFSIAVRRVVPVDEYLAGVERELAMRYPPDGRWEADTLYFGGGTPSRLGGEGVARLVEMLRRRIDLAPGAEVTLEANPEDVDRASAALWRGAGVNRVSLGAQSFDARVLEWMHRVHGPERIGEAVDALRAEGIDELSLDLIFALPERLERWWSRDLERAIALAPAHLSFYGLTIEPGTPLGRWRARGAERESPEERYEAEFLEADARLAAAGYDHYEVSNYARPGHRARHNSSYWAGVPYAGLGPGAHEFDGRARRWNVGAYAEWVRRLAAGESSTEGSEALLDANRVDEAVYLGLRTVDGLRLLPGESEHVRPWVEAGWAVERDGKLVLTALGWLRLDALATDLTLLRSR